MKFEKLHKDLPDNINCIKSEYKEDTKTTFARKIHDDPIEALSEVNFMSYWENGKRPPTKENNICNYKGVSLFVNRNESTRNHFKDLFYNAKQFKRKHQSKKKYCLLKLKPKSGVVSKPDRNTFHCNLFKSDIFTVEDSIELLKILDI